MTDERRGKELEKIKRRRRSILKKIRERESKDVTPPSCVSLAIPIPITFTELYIISIIRFIKVHS